MWVEYDRRNPDDPSTLLSLGDVGLKLGKGSEYAERLILRAIELDKEYYKAYFDLGVLYLGKNEFSKAEKNFKDFTRLRPEDAEGYFHLAIAQNQNAAQSILSFETSLKKGFNDYERIKSEKRLAALRSKPEYKMLLKEYFPGKE
jgi:tetratricopeptide (TPR) repeat protein